MGSRPSRQPPRRDLRRWKPASRRRDRACAVGRGRSGTIARPKGAAARRNATSPQLPINGPW